MTKIRLPKNCTIHEDAFNGLSQVAVFAPKGGSTEAFCYEQDNLIFVDCE